MADYATRCSALRALLSDGQEHPGAELERVGGRRFAGRVHEIRRGLDGQPPLQVDCETRGSESFWRVSLSQEAKPPSPSRPSRKWLEAEVARLRAELERVKKKTQQELFAEG